MSVTLEVSKLSGWLNTDARCRVEGRACDAGGRGASWEAGGPGVVTAHKRGMHGEKARLTQGLGAKGTRGAHREHVVHGRDAGGVEAQRLVEGRRVLPSRREGMRFRGERGASREAGGPVVCGGTQETCTGKRPVSRLGGQGHARRAHQEHLAHGRDAGGVKAQWLVEGQRALPSQREGLRCGREEV
jgi:hypothetical protein